MNKILLCAMLASALAAQAQLAKGAKKFLGNITTNYQVRTDFPTYWNQITGENECKWGSVESTRDVYTWDGCDRIYDYAQQNGIPAKFHTLVWGSQYPGHVQDDPTAGWLMQLSTADQLAEITEWFDEVQKRYPDLEIIDVVNEAIVGHAPAPFKEALGGDGTSGFDWVINSFKMARERWPKALLVYNDYNELTWDTNKYIALLNAIKGSGYVDAMGFQSHGLEGLDSTTLRARMENIHNAVGLPILISEYDVDIEDDAKQKDTLAEQFPVFWETDYVIGVTFWGYVYGATWVKHSGLLNSNGGDRPAFAWLKEYIATHLDVPSQLDWNNLSVTPVPQEPFGGSAHAIPGKIEAEAYDLGGEGKGYHEANALGNQGGATLRGTDQTDIETSSDTSGVYNIGYTLQDEWLAYTVNVAAAGTYNIGLRIATSGDGKTMHLELGGKNISGVIEVPNTADWQNWTTVILPDIELSAGAQELRVVFDANYINLNWIEFTAKVPETTGSLPSNLGLNLKLYNTISRSTFSIQADNEYFYRIVSPQGATLESGWRSGMAQVGPHLVPGAYILNIQDRQGNGSTYKILKQ